MKVDVTRFAVSGIRGIPSYENVMLASLPPTRRARPPF